jgi:hypothetical protein
MALDINAPTVWRFELPLDEKISVITVLHTRKVDLEIFASRVVNGYV